MISLPPEPSTGRPILDWASLVMTFLRRVRPIAGSGIMLSEGTQGFTISSTALGSQNSQSLQPFQLFVGTDPADTTVPPAPKIRVISSTLAGGTSTDLGFSFGDSPGYYLDPAEGVLVGGITFDPASGAPVTSRWLEILDHFPTSDEVPDGTDYVEIGTVHWVADPLDLVNGGHWTVTNSRYGPITAQICRNWLASEAPFFTVTWS